MVVFRKGLRREARKEEEEGGAAPSLFLDLCHFPSRGSGLLGFTTYQNFCHPHHYNLFVLFDDNQVFLLVFRGHTEWVLVPHPSIPTSPTCFPQTKQDTKAK